MHRAAGLAFLMQIEKSDRISPLFGRNGCYAAWPIIVPHVIELWRCCVARCRIGQSVVAFCAACYRIVALLRRALSHYCVIVPRVVAFRAACYPIVALLCRALSLYGVVVSHIVALSRCRAACCAPRLASVRRPRTLISIWTLVSCVRVCATQLTKFQIEISVRGRCTEATPRYVHKITIFLYTIYACLPEADKPQRDNARWR